MKRYAIIQDNIVISVIIWDGLTEWKSPQGTHVVQSDTLNAGDNYSIE
jgi:hypothetical protein